MKSFITWVVAVTAVWVSTAEAQRREHERERFQTPHWVFDNRFHHDHYYPALGYPVAVLPPGNVAIAFGGGRYWFHSGVWYQAAGPGYVVARPPVTRACATTTHRRGNPSISSAGAIGA